MCIYLIRRLLQEMKIAFHDRKVIESCRSACDSAARILLKFSFALLFDGSSELFVTQFIDRIEMCDMCH